MSILITAFEPYHHWKENASLMCLRLLEKDESINSFLSTNVYPVDFLTARELLYKDIVKDFDYIIHLGQTDISSKLTLEKVGKNFGEGSEEFNEHFNNQLTDDGPFELTTNSDIERWHQLLDRNNIPNEISTDAGTYLCNAVLYWSLYTINQRNLKTRTSFIHIPPDKTQIVSAGTETPSSDIGLSIKGLKLIINDIISVSGQGGVS